MHIVGEIKLSKSAETSDLYIRCNKVIDKLAGVKLLARWFQVATKSRSEWSSLSTQ